jgi:hypothetical protein
MSVFLAENQRFALFSHKHAIAEKFSDWPYRASTAAIAAALSASLPA